MIDIPGVVRYAKGATQAQYDEAKAILEALDVAYPGHPWSVEIKGDNTGGLVFIRHLGFQNGNWGMNVRHTRKDPAYYSSSAWQREIILKVGEWLERLGLPRTKYDPDRPLMYSADGVPGPKPMDMDVVIDSANRDLRDTPRPQVEKQLKETANDATAS